ncbi:MAG: hypothetical protein A2284_07370 [Deltaproteobacteria bacterium RIFOXYA12_FULL_61_11]|nr:MAG: hypothetical protein A2284_07370 [Deltaproteobacteria bacterium RIFOXYA12_FULL_61_11]
MIVDEGFYCYKCKKEVLMEVRITRFDTCDFCGVDLRVCFNCRFHDLSYPNECREIGTAYVRERDRGNFCASFEFAKGKDRLSGAEVAKDEVKSKLDALFKK